MYMSEVLARRDDLFVQVQVDVLLVSRREAVKQKNFLDGLRCTVLA